MTACAMRRRSQLRQGNERQECEHRDDGDVLKKQDGKARLATGAVQKPFFAEGLQNDRGRRQRQHATGGNRHLPWLAEQQGKQRDSGDGADDLQPAEAEQLGAQFPQHRRLQFETDEEEHHHHAKFGHVLHVVRFLADEMQGRADENAGEQVAKYRAEAEAFRQRHDQHGGGKVNEGSGE